RRPNDQIVSDGTVERRPAAVGTTCATGRLSAKAGETLHAPLHDAIDAVVACVPLAHGHVDVVEPRAGDDVAAVELSDVGVVLLAPGGPVQEGDSGALLPRLRGVVQELGLDAVVGVVEPGEEPLVAEAAQAHLTDDLVTQRSCRLAPAPPGGVPAPRRV